MDGIRYVSCHPLQRVRYGVIQFSSHSWTEISNGSGVLEGSITLPRDQTARQLVIDGTRPDEAVIYRQSDKYGYTDGYIVVSREWDAATREIKIVALELRSWLFSVMLGPEIDMSSDIQYSWLNVDQLEIAEDIILWATWAGESDGRPWIDWEYNRSGKMRDLSFSGLQFKTAGELLDSIARRSGGFEWTVVPTQDPEDGLPNWTFRSWVPERGSLMSGIILRRTANSTNFTLTQSPKISSEDRRTRVWTTGSTETPQYAADSDPALASGSVLLRESATNYNSVTDRTTLSSHARSERLFYSSPLTTLQGAVDPSQIDVLSYRAGDRCRVVYQDELFDLDLPAARILTRKVSESTGAVTSVQVTLDLNDTVLPETDSGGSV